LKGLKFKPINGPLHDPAEVKTKKPKLKGLKFKSITGPATEQSKAWQRAMIAARNAAPPYKDLKLQTIESDLHPVTSSAVTYVSDDEEYDSDERRPGEFANFLVKMDMQVRSMELANARKGAAHGNPLEHRVRDIPSKDGRVKKRKLDE